MGPEKFGYNNDEKGTSDTFDAAGTVVSVSICTAGGDVRLVAWSVRPLKLLVQPVPKASVEGLQAEVVFGVFGLIGVPGTS